MENTLENKSKFFGQYANQRICRYTDWMESGYHIPRTPDVQNNQHLELTPLSDITDEDALWVGRDANEFNYSYSDDLKYSLELIARMETNPHLINFKQSDYLRSKGYALPYMGLSVEELIEFGWVKFKTTKDED